MFDFNDLPMGTSFGPFDMGCDAAAMLKILKNEMRKIGTNSHDLLMDLVEKNFDRIFDKKTFNYADYFLQDINRTIVKEETVDSVYFYHLCEMSSYLKRDCEEHADVNLTT